MAQKKKLLIYWVSRTFIEFIAPLIPALTKQFEVVVLLSNQSTPQGLNELLDGWKKNNVIEQYILLPKVKSRTKFHLCMAKIIPLLKRHNFDLWLTCSEMQVPERYIFECILPKHCISVCMSHNNSFLFMYNEKIVQQLLAGETAPTYQRHTWPKTTTLPTHAIKKFLILSDADSSMPLSKAGFLLRIRKQVRRFTRQSLSWFIITKINTTHPLKLIKIYTDYIVNRIVFPLLIAHKTFPLGPYDSMTQLGSGRSNALILFDDREAEAHALLFKHTDVYVAQYPSKGSCQCNHSETLKSTILSPLSGFLNLDSISDDALYLFYRDFKTVMTKTNARNIHLRVHPDGTGRWPEQLRHYLAHRGIDAKVVDCTRPIREIMCDYLGMAGYGSSALRDGRASCNYAFVIGFAGISKLQQFSNPKFVYGKSDGIEWIEEDGNYDPQIFTRQKHCPPERKTVDQIMAKLAYSTFSSKPTQTTGATTNKKEGRLIP
tara:strand:+ start:7251 stop:8717 length:1467 start_codon:yes stop_codon:yes gene_type:complete